MLAHIYQTTLNVLNSLLCYGMVHGTSVLASVLSSSKKNTTYKNTSDKYGYYQSVYCDDWDYYFQQNLPLVENHTSFLPLCEWLAGECKSTLFDILVWSDKGQQKGWFLG